MKSSIIILDSSQRNTALYPSNNKWTYNSPKQYINPKKVELISAIIANSQYVINSNNYQFNLTYSGTLYTATLTKQNYTASTLATSLATALNGLSVPSTTFTVSTNTDTLTFTITSTNAVVYNFSKNTTLSQLLGFPITDSSSNSSITSTNCYTVNTTRYYKVYIKELRPDFDTNISNSFNFIILNNVNSGEYLYLTDINNVNNSHEIDLKMNLSSLNIEIRDEWDQLCDFNGVYYLLFFKIYH